MAQTWNDSSERQLALEIVLNALEVLPWEKLPGVADAVEAIEIAVAGDGETFVAFSRSPGVRC